MDNKGSVVKIIAITLLFLSIIGIVLVALPYLRYNELLFALIVILGGSICAIHTFILYTFGSMYQYIVKIEKRLTELENAKPVYIEAKANRDDKDDCKAIKQVLNSNPIMNQLRDERKAIKSNEKDAENLLKQAKTYLADADYEKANEYADYYLDIKDNDVNAYLVKMFADLKVRNYDELKETKVALSTSNNYGVVLNLADPGLRNDLIILNANLEDDFDSKRKEEDLYNDAVTKFNNEEYDEALALFSRIENYKDVNEYLTQTQAKLSDIESENTYNEAVNLMQINDLASLKYAKDKFLSILEYKDANDLMNECIERIEKIIALEEEAKQEAERKLRKKKKRNRILLIIFFVIILLAMGLGYYAHEYYLPKYKAEQAIKTYETALETNNLSDLKAALDSERVLAKDENHRLNYNEIAKRLGLVDSYNLVDEYLVNINNEARLDYATYGDETDPYYQNLKAINNSIAISSNNGNLIALKHDGTVQVVNKDVKFSEFVKDWQDIIDVKMAEDFAIALNGDGHILVAGNEHKSIDSILSLENVVAIEAGDSHVLALTSEGKVVAAGTNSFNQLFTSDWTDIVAIAAGDLHSVGLKSDGSVVATGNNHKGQCVTNNWTDIIKVAAGANHTIGLKADGSLVATGDNEFGQCDIEDWHDVVMIYASENESIGITKDGEVLTTNPERFKPTTEIIDASMILTPSEAIDLNTNSEEESLNSTEEDYTYEEVE